MARARIEIVAVVAAAAKQDRPVKRRQRLTQAGIPLPRIDQRTIPAMRYRALLDSYTSVRKTHNPVNVASVRRFDEARSIGAKKLEQKPVKSVREPVLLTLFQTFDRC